MKQCPACNRTYTDAAQVYCLEDGSVLQLAHDPQATIRIPAARATDIPETQRPAVLSNPIYPAPPPSKRWPLYGLIALLLLMLGGGVAALLILGYSSTTSSSVNNNQLTGVAAALSGPTPQASPSPSPTPDAQTLVGVWRTNVYEQKVPTEITLTFRANGTTHYVFKDKRGVGTANGTWRYSDETLFEKFGSGGSGQGSIRWLDQDTFELTIADNGIPAYKGLKRLYKRVS
jgi:hypothetical protein